MLKFIGSGSAFNTKLGNNGAFIKSEDGKTLFMIDCGSATFSRLRKFGILDGVQEVYVLMTHFHPDHCGSLGDLIFHMCYKQRPHKPGVRVITPDVEALIKYAEVVGLTGREFLVTELNNMNEYNCSIEGICDEMVIYPIRTIHDKNLKAYSYIIFFNSKIIYYSGDTNVIMPFVLEMIKSDDLVAFYQDTNTLDYPDNVHLSLKKLTEQIPEEYRHKVWCMHLDELFDRDEYESLGFNAVRNIEEEME